MISRFNLDVKRMNYYDDKSKFDIEFKVNSESNNENDQILEIQEPQILIVYDAPIKISILSGSSVKILILYSNQSISLLSGDKVNIYENKNKISKFKLFTLINA